MVRQRFTGDRWAGTIDPFIERPNQAMTWFLLWSELNAWDSLFDRTGALPHPLRIENLRPMPAVDQSFAAPLESICLERARELAAEGRPLRVFWSGGIDSTLVVCSFLMAGVPVDQLELLYTADSMIEYPEFLTRSVPPGVKRTQIRAFPHHNFVPDRQAHAYLELPCMGDFIDPALLNVTGGLGDKLFNSHTLLTRFGYDKAFRRYDEVLPKSLLWVTEPLVAACPLPTVSLSQFIWWVYFALYYQDELLQVLGGVSDASVADKRDATRVFFDSPAFQQWALHHRDRVATDDPAKLKLDAKQLIFKHTADSEYLHTKLKAGSLKFRKTPNVAWDTPILFILDDGSVVRANDE